MQIACLLQRGHKATHALILHETPCYLAVAVRGAAAIEQADRLQKNFCASGEIRWLDPLFRNMTTAAAAGHQKHRHGSDARYEGRVVTGTGGHRSRRQRVKTSALSEQLLQTRIADGGLTIRQYMIERTFYFSHLGNPGCFCIQGSDKI